MPCDSRYQIEIDFTKGDLTVLSEAVKAMGYKVEYNNQVTSLIARHPQGHVLTWTKGENLRMNTLAAYAGYEKEFKQELLMAYGNAAVQTMAKRTGWQAKSIGENQYQLSRR